jgi:tetratricopeptide (TPR) repeat protein
LYYAQALFFLGEACIQRGRHAEAAEHLGTSLDVVRRSVGFQHPKVPYVAHQYANALRLLGRLPEARATFDEVTAAVAGRYGKGHYVYANALVHHGHFLLISRRPADAEVKFREALAVYDRTGGRRRKLYDRCVEDLCEALRAQNKHDDVVRLRASLRGK